MRWLDFIPVVARNFARVEVIKMYFFIYKWLEYLTPCELSVIESRQNRFGLLEITWKKQTDDNLINRYSYRSYYYMHVVKTINLT